MKKYIVWILCLVFSIAWLVIGYNEDGLRKLICFCTCNIFVAAMFIIIALPETNTTNQPTIP